MTAVIQHSAETLRKRQLYSRLWASAVILWSVTRTVIIWAALALYSVDAVRHARAVRRTAATAPV